jgi:hypothetical protein
VPASYVPPFLITVYPADDSADNLKSVVISPTKGKNPRAPVTPLTNLLIEADYVYLNAETTTTQQRKERLEARRKQISDALANVFTQILGAEKAKNYDFLSDSNFVPGSNTDLDLLLDNIKVDTDNLEISLKKAADKKIALSKQNTDTVTPIAEADVSTNTVRFTKRNLSYFVGTFPGTIKFTNYDYKGVAKGSETSQSGTMTFKGDGTISETYGNAKWTGMFKLNDAGYSVKISGKISAGDSSSGTFVGSIDNDGKLSMTFNTKGTGDQPDTTRGYVTGTGSKN